MIGSMNTGKTKISTRFISDLYIEKQQVTVGV
jgi:GTPase SAR1 family protein